MKNITRMNGLALLAVALVMVGCSNSPDQQIWTSKNQSMLGVTSDTPTLNVNEEVITGAADSAIKLREPAIAVLLQAAESRNALLRANAIEALHAAPEFLPQVLSRSLGDPNRAVRFAAAISVGKFRLTEFMSLTEPLLHDESKSVQASAMYAIKRCGKTIDLNPLAAMLSSNNPEDKGNAAFVLGELGDASAINLLRQSAAQGLQRIPQARRKIVELQLAEAMVKLGATNEIDVIRASLFASEIESELAALACQMCGELNDAVALADLTNLIHRTGDAARPAEVRMAAAMAAAKIAPDRAMVEVPAAYSSSPKAALRAQAAHTFGAMGRGGNATLVALSHLSRLMQDTDALVQVASAGSILRLQPTVDF